MKTKNCHARSKQKRAKLRLKNMLSRVRDKRYEKMVKANEPKGETLTGRASDHAIYIPFGKYKWMFDSKHTMQLNQRQRRKLERQVPQRRRA